MTRNVESSRTVQGGGMATPNNSPKRHHFIPQMMLRHFADDDGKLWFWRRDFPIGEVKKAQTQNLFVEKDLYTFIASTGIKDVALETFFARLEGAGAKFINDLASIVRDNAVPSLDQSAWDFWHQFFYYHLKRTPGAIAAFAENLGFQGKVDEAVAKIRQIRIEEGRDPDEAGLAERIFKNAVVVAQKAAPSQEVLKAFNDMGLAIYRIADPKKSFVIGDVPGVTARFRLSDNRMSPPTLFLPLTWDIALGQTTNPKTVDLVRVECEQIRRMNIATTARSTLIAGRSDALLRSLSRDVIYAEEAPQ